MKPLKELWFQFQVRGHQVQTAVAERLFLLGRKNIFFCLPKGLFKSSNAFSVFCVPLLLLLSLLLWRPQPNYLIWSTIEVLCFSLLLLLWSIVQQPLFYWLSIFCTFLILLWLWVELGNTKGGSIPVPLTSCLTCLD
jgi:hypothetical protein